MIGFELVKELSRRPGPSLFHVFEPLTDAFLRIGARGDVEQPLIGFRVLYDSRCLAIYGEHQGALGFPEPLHEVAGGTAKGRQRLDVGCDVKHERLQCEHLIRCFKNSALMHD